MNMLHTSDLSKVNEKIAIIGIGCALPGGVESATALWTFLREGRDGIVEVPADRWSVDAVYDPQPGTPGKLVSRRAAFLGDITSFDAAFFGISPREAAVMDPQQRLLLEVTWRALEDAGIPAESLSGSNTGVYVGISHSDYHAIQQFGRRQIDVHTSTGGALSIAANRLSHRFDLRGPSLAVDTACSSSLVALDIARTALLTGECDMALVGGVNVMLTPDVSITFSRAAMLAPDGRCKAFDEQANGYVRGEGAAIIVLKPLSRALLDGDRIHAVICATAVNQDGHTSTITVPSRDAQVAMLRQACDAAHIEPAQISYVEAHGTGTPIGDPIEAHAIGSVFGQNRPPEAPCIIGSIKTNMGHLEPAAGVVGLIKAALCVREGEIPPSLNFKKPNPRINFAELGIRVQCDLGPWPKTTGSRIAAVNSFGFGGTNACAIVEEPPTRVSKPDRVVPHRWWPIMLPVSAANKKALSPLCSRFADLIDADPNALADTVGTAALRRSHLDHRVVALAPNAVELSAALRAAASGETVPTIVAGRRAPDKRLAFVFTGQGSQWWGMGRRLLEVDSVFREIVEQCDQVFAERSGWSLIHQLRAPENRSRMDETSVAQPATFAIQVGLAKRLAEWGVKPDIVIGHSIGEIAAAYAAGALSLSDAVDVVYHRSRLQEQSRFQGGMAAVGLDVESARAYLAKFDGHLEIAAINGPELVTIAGPRTLLEEFVQSIADQEKQILGQMLRVDYAFHSYQMEAFTDELRGSLARLRPTCTKIPMVSTVTGDIVRGDDLDASYWCRNMRDPVLFQQAIDKSTEKGFQIFLELGAHPSLVTPIRSCLGARNRDGVAIGTLHRERDDTEALSSALASLHVHGAEIDWHTVVPPGWKFVDLFGYPWEKQVHWAESEESKAARFQEPVHPLLGYRMRTVEPIWQTEIDAGSPSYLLDHQIEGTIVFPAAGYVELVLAAAREMFGDFPHEVEDIAFHEALLLSNETATLLETSVDEVRGIVKVRSRHRGPNTSWSLRATARIRRWPVPELPIEQWTPEVEPPTQIGHTRFYRDLEQEGHQFGRTFQGVETLWFSEGYSLGKITLSDAITDAARYILHPAQLDSCFHIIRGFRGFGANARSGGTMAIPVAIRQLRLFRRPTVVLYARARVQAHSSTEIVAHISILNDAGQVVATIDGFRCLRVDRSSTRQQVVAAGFYREHWVPLSPRAEGSEDSANCAGSWLILADGGGVGTALAKLIEQRGGKVVLAFNGRGAHLFVHQPGGVPGAVISDAASYRHVIAAMPPPNHVVHLWTLDEPNEAPTTASLTRARRAGIDSLLLLVRSLAEVSPKPRIWVATAGALTPIEHDAPLPTVMLHAGCVGFLRTLHNEHPEFRPTLIDLDPADISAARLFAEISVASDETEVALRQDNRFGCRFESQSPDALPPLRRKWNLVTRTPAFRVAMTAPGLLENLALVSMDRPQPKAGEVVVEVRAVGLNFRDIMAATNLLPAGAEDQPAWQRLGLECSGVVCAIGEGVDKKWMGRRVIAVTAGCLASHIAVPADQIYAMPRKLSFAAAAAIPIAFATAHHALVTLGHISAGEKVLIHAAAGGVGLAAVALAKLHGAEILATAGSQDKRLYLHSLGIEHVFQSRSLAFADGIMWKTGDRGVDLVLNSLPSPFLEKGLSVLAPGGRFLEIGKRDVYADTPIGLYSMRNNAAFHAIDLAKLAAEKPEAMRAEISSVIRSLRRDKLQPIPVTTFPVSKVTEAFRFMAKAQHIGKVVISFDDKAAMVPEAPATIRPVTTNATYLITGGTKGLGLETARWLVNNGATSLVLVGRSQVLDAKASEVIDELRASGCVVELVQADVSKHAGVRAAMSAARRTGRPLRGIIHAAGVIDDVLIAKMDTRHIKRVFAGKVLGAWHLHERTKSLALDFFVLYSSIATSLGSIGQAHYAAANRYLDAIAAHRRAQGLPATSVGFGPINDCGYLATRPDVGKSIDAAGTQTMPAASALEALGTLLRHAATNVSFAKVNWSKLSHTLSLLACSPRTSGLVQVVTGGSGGAESRLRAAFLETPEDQRPKIITDYLRRKVAAVLKIEPKAVEINRPLSEIGLDSLTGFELKNRIENDLGVGLPIGKFLQRPTIAAIVPVVIETINSDTRTISGQADSEGLNLHMSIGQEALWFLDKLDPGNPAYGLVACIAVRPHFDDRHIEEVIQQLLARHENLRLAFPSDGVGPVPTLLPLEQCRMTRHDVTALSEEALVARLEAEIDRPFDIEEGPLGRLHLFRRADRDVFLLHFHHIIADAMSIAVLMNEVFESYMALQSKLPPPPPPRRAPFGQFAHWQRSIATGAEGEKHRGFWKAELQDAPPALLLNTDRPRSSTPLGPGSAQQFILKNKIVTDLKNLAKVEQTTLFAVLLAAFTAMLHRYSGEPDIIVGTPASGRTRTEFERTVGYLVNALPIRTRLTKGMSFKQLLAEVDSKLRATLEHQDYPFPLIVRDSDPPRGAAGFPFFQIMFGMERFDVTDTRGHAAMLLNVAGPAVKFRGFTAESVPLPRRRAPFDMTFTLEEFDNQIFGIVDYRSDLWEKSTISRFVDHYQAILHQIATTPSHTVDDLILDGRMTAISGPPLTDRPDVVDSIRMVAARYPSAIAISGCDRSVTYRELIDRVDAATSILIEKGIGPRSVVGIHLPRSSDLPIAMLAVLAAGAAYVPLDPTYPAARLAALIKATKPAAIIVKDGAASNLPGSATLLAVDALKNNGRSDTAPPVQPDVKPGGLAYIIHTSGSTGIPSGVEIERSALANLLAAMRAEIPLSCGDTFVAVTTIAFDIAALELFLPLTVGARLVVADEDVVRDGVKLLHKIQDERATMVQATPATWQMLIDAGWKGHKELVALCGGEALPSALAAKLQSCTKSLWNLYGPTETTIWSTIAKVTNVAGSISIGRPIANTYCYVVDADLKPVCQGITGELLIGGMGLARGYRNDPARTAERFVADPLDPSGRKVFRTGDYVCIGTDGTIQFQGRRDQQVKIRGFRIELGEIESALRSLTAVQDAVVLAVGEDLLDRRLCAFIAINDKGNADHISAHLRHRLPPYMVPSDIRVVDALPRLPNGKIDRQLLAQQAQKPRVLTHENVAPRSPVETQIANILKEVLGHDQFGINDNFFSLGGTSLLGMRFVSRINDVYNIGIGAVELMRAPTVASMAALIVSRVTSGSVLGRPDEQLTVDASVGHKFWRPLPIVRAQGSFDNVNAAAIAYLPDDLLEAARLLHAEGSVRRQLPAIDDPQWGALCQLRLGTVALILMPRFGTDLIADTQSALGGIEAAIDYADRLGAKAVALTGILPTITDFGRALRHRENIAITTGHGATASAVLMTSLAIARRARRDLSDERVAFVGLGAIGTATLRLLLDRANHPHSLILCDVPAKRAHLEALAKEIRSRYHYSGTIDFAHSVGPAPQEIYRSRFIIAAASVRELISIDRLAPGTIVVDDSFPHCFDVNDAITRMKSRGDVLLVDGGLISPPGEVAWNIMLPNNLAALVGRDHNIDLLPRSGEITACIFSALMVESQSVTAMTGPATIEECHGHWEALARLGVVAAQLRCGTYILSEDVMSRFTASPAAYAGVEADVL